MGLPWVSHVSLSGVSDLPRISMDSVGSHESHERTLVSGGRPWVSLGHP